MRASRPPTPQRSSKRTPLFFLCVLFLFSGCYGMIGEPPSKQRPDPQTPPIGQVEQPPSTPDASTDTTPPPPPDQSTPEEPTQPPLAQCAIPNANQLRRLTRIEYRYSIYDLLGVEIDAYKNFPPDEQTFGFAVGEGVSLLLSQAYIDTSEEAVKKADLDKLLPCSLEQADEACIKGFITDFGRRAYRRPLKTEEESKALALFQQIQAKHDNRIALKNLLQMFLQSPHFLYRIERGQQGTTGSAATPLHDYEIATRLAYLLWVSSPDATLLEAAAQGKLRTTAEITNQARRMLDDPKAKRTIRYFFQQWLELDKLDNMSRSQDVYPTFTTELARDMRQETERFIEHVIWEGDASLKTLLTARFGFINQRLAEHYGLSGVQGTDLQRVEFPAEQQRAGLLTQGSFLAIHANKDQSSPIHRGLFVRTRLLCQIPDPPPDNIVVEAPNLDPNLTTRERFEQHRSDPACSGCHMLMDPIGFGFEHFDAIGRFRDKDGQHNVDASGHFYVTDDINGAFTGTVEMAQRLAQSQQVQRCFVRQWYRYTFAREETPRDACFVESVSQEFIRSGGNIKELIVAITGHQIFAHLKGDLNAAIGKGSAPLTPKAPQTADCSAFQLSLENANLWLFLFSLLLAWLFVRRIGRIA